MAEVTMRATTELGAGEYAAFVKWYKSVYGENTSPPPNNVSVFDTTWYQYWKGLGKPNFTSLSEMTPKQQQQYNQNNASGLPAYNPPAATGETKPFPKIDPYDQAQLDFAREQFEWDKQNDLWARRNQGQQTPEWARPMSAYQKAQLELSRRQVDIDRLNAMAASESPKNWIKLMYMQEKLRPEPVGDWAGRVKYSGDTIKQGDVVIADSAQEAAAQGASYWYPKEKWITEGREAYVQARTQEVTQMREQGYQMQGNKAPKDVALGEAAMGFGDTERTPVEGGGSQSSATLPEITPMNWKSGIQRSGLQSTREPVDRPSPEQRIRQKVTGWAYQNIPNLVGKEGAFIQPSAQLWNRMPWTTQQRTLGYSGWKSDLSPDEAGREMLGGIQRSIAAPSWAQRWKPSKQFV